MSNKLNQQMLLIIPGESCIFFANHLAIGVQHVTKFSRQDFLWTGSVMGVCGSLFDVISTFCDGSLHRGGGKVIRLGRWHIPFHSNDMMDSKYQLIRVRLSSRKMFFQHIQALTCYHCFDSFDALLGPA